MVDLVMYLPTPLAFGLPFELAHAEGPRACKKGYRPVSARQERVRIILATLYAPELAGSGFPFPIR